jgi:predicted dehydrogenase
MRARKFRIGLIGAGMAGQAHAFGYRNASMADSLAGVSVELAHVADQNADLAADVAARYGFSRFGTSAEELLADPTIDAVSIALPNGQHVDIVAKAIQSGKHILTEKPLGMSGTEAAELQKLAAHSKATLGVGFSYRRIPGLAALRQAVADGEIGDIYHFETSYYASYAADPELPFSWRFDHSTSGGGALIDLGAHAVDAVEYVVGDISEVISAVFHTVVPRRRNQTTGMQETVTNDDFALLTLAAGKGAAGGDTNHRGAVGTLQASRVAHGKPNALSLTVFGSRGHASFSTEAFNEFQLHQRGAGEVYDGPRRIITGPAHPIYSDVSPFRSRGVGTGYGEAFIAQVQEFLRCALAGQQMDTDFAAAAHTMRVIDAAVAAMAGTPVLVANPDVEAPKPGHRPAQPLVVAAATR